MVSRDEIEAASAHVEEAPGKEIDDDDDDVASVTDEARGDDLPERYYLKLNFIGLFVGLVLSAASLYLYLQGPSAILVIINNDLGPSNQIAWWSIGRTAAQSLTFVLIGRLSDIFGRRYFIVGGNALAVIGVAVTASSQNVVQLIIGAVITGLGESVQNSYTIVLPELVKNKHRPVIISLIFAATAPFAAFSAIIAQRIISSGLSWRWTFYLPLIGVGLATILIFLFYHPPHYRQIHAHTAKTKVDQLRALDFVGIALYVVGIVLILLPVSWGGSLFPWKSAATIAPLIIGVVDLTCLGLWETYGKVESPFIPVRLLKNRGYLALVLCACAGSCCYYSATLLWPQQISRQYQISGDYAGWLSTTVGGAAALGGATTFIWIKIFRNSKFVMMAASIGLVAFVAALAAQGTRGLNLGIAFTLLGSYCVGVIETTALSLAPLFCKEEDLGLASGLLGTMRTAVASLAVAVYTSVLSTRLADTIPHYVVPAAEEAGFDPSNLPALLAAAKTGVFTKVPGITPGIVSAVNAVLPIAYSQAFRTVYLSSIAFGSLAIIGSLLSSNAQPLLTDTIARKMQDSQTRKEVESSEKAQL